MKILITTLLVLATADTNAQDVHAVKLWAAGRQRMLVRIDGRPWGANGAKAALAAREATGSSGRGSVSG